MTHHQETIGSILFICTGNSCRSVMAEGLMRKKLYELGKKGIEVSSAGIAAMNGLPPTDETIAVMEQEGVDVSTFESKRVTREMIRNARLILTMEPEHKVEMLRIDRDAYDKTFLLKEYACPSKVRPDDFVVHDPIGRPVEEYRACRDEIKKEIERIVESI